MCVYVPCVFELHAFVYMLFVHLSACSLYVCVSLFLLCVCVHTIYCVCMCVSVCEYDYFSALAR